MNDQYINGATIFVPLILTGLRIITFDPLAKKTECGFTPSIKGANEGPYKFSISHFNK